MVCKKKDDKLQPETINRNNAIHYSRDNNTHEV